MLEGRLVDLKSGQAIVGKRYRSQFNLARRVGHTFADEIVLFFTGRRGVALTTIAFYSDRDGGAKEIFLMDADGANQRRITGHKSISMSPAWRPAPTPWPTSRSSTARRASTWSSWPAGARAR